MEDNTGLGTSCHGPSAEGLRQVCLQFPRGVPNRNPTGQAWPRSGAKTLPPPRCGTLTTRLGQTPRSRPTQTKLTTTSGNARPPRNSTTLRNASACGLGPVHIPFSCRRPPVGRNIAQDTTTTREESNPPPSSSSSQSQGQKGLCPRTKGRPRGESGMTTMHPHRLRRDGCMDVRRHVHRGDRNACRAENTEKSVSSCYVPLRWTMSLRQEPPILPRTLRG